MRVLYRAMGRKTQSGFTLVELIITLILASIILGLGVPSFVDLVDSNRMISVTNELVGDLQYARNEAIKRNASVTMCGSSNGTSCSGSTSWENGWIVFTDPNVNATVDGGEAIVRGYGGTNGEPTIRVTTGTVGSSVSFDGDGFPRTLANLIQSGTFSICDSRGIGGAGTEFARAVQLGASGRIRATRNQGVITCP